LVSARPYCDQDVGFHAVSGPLVDWVRTEHAPVQIDVLRPPTFSALQEQLGSHPGRYHIVHFDGHGGYGETDPSRFPHEFRGAQGHLVFEDADGHGHTVPAQKLTTLLAEYRIPIMVLNACQSARSDLRAEDPFASTAAALLKAGIRSVVAMGYNLYVSGAERFVPAFYRRLLQTGDVAEATRTGRIAMLKDEGRTCARGEYPLQDWLVPMLYQQEAVLLPVQSRASTAPTAADLPSEAQTLGDYGFIGRQDAIHQLECALQRQAAAAILIYGTAGIGKTTLVKGFLQWLQHTNGLAAAQDDPVRNSRFVGTLWFAFDDIRSAEYVINRLLAVFFGDDGTALPLQQKLPTLIQALREQPLLIVWDNFEAVAGIEGTEVAPLLVEPDRVLLNDLLRQLRGGRSKILITSRSSEDWLAPTEAFRLPLRGLRGEDAWTYCNAVVRDLGLQLDRSDKDCLELLQDLDGHPLALRSVLLQLTDTPARELLNRLKQEFAGQTGDESTRRILAPLALFDRGLPDEYGPVLQMIGLHQRYVEIDSVAHMMQFPDESPERQTLNRCFHVLERGGLLHQAGHGIYSMHPALRGFLAAAHPAGKESVERFVTFMGLYADALAHKDLHEQRALSAVHGANFRNALTCASQVSDLNAASALTQSLALVALNSRDFASAKDLFERLALAGLMADDQGGTASAYHQLGTIAEEQRDFETAERWYLESLAISEKHGNERGAASTYHQLGRVAEERRDFETAERWYLRSLAIKEKHGNEYGAASTYHQLGMIAEEQRDFETAERWYLKSLAIEEKHGNEHGAAATFHQLGIVAQERRDFETAEHWYLKSLAVKERYGDEHGAASTYHQLGIIAQEQCDFDTAERWYLKSLAIKEKQGNMHGAASTYHQLGTIAQQTRDWRAAESWYSRSIANSDKLADAYSAAMSYYNRGVLRAQQDLFDTAIEDILRATEKFRVGTASRELFEAQRALIRYLPQFLQAQRGSPATVRGILATTAEALNSIEETVVPDSILCPGLLLIVQALKQLGKSAGWNREPTQLDRPGPAAIFDTPVGIDLLSDSAEPQGASDVKVIRAYCWHSIGDCFRALRSHTDDKRQTPDEVHAYENAAKLYAIALDAVDLVRKLPNAASLMLLEIACLSNIGAWNRALQRAKDFYGVLESAQPNATTTEQVCTVHKVDIILAMANLQRKLGDYESAVRALQDARRLLIRVNDSGAASRVVEELAILHLQAGRPDLALQAIKKFEAAWPAINELRLGPVRKLALNALQNK
jgi:tetratricopeptide (TPR) repeat protein